MNAGKEPKNQQTWDELATKRFYNCLRRAESRDVFNLIAIDHPVTVYTAYRDHNSHRLLPN